MILMPETAANKPPGTDGNHWFQIVIAFADGPWDGPSTATSGGKKPCGIATVIWWPKNQIGLYPFVNILGGLLLILSVYLRQMAFRKKLSNIRRIWHFYLSICALIFSIALGYGSVFLIAYVLIIGLLLTYWNYIHEVKVFSNFSDYVKKQGMENLKQTDYRKYWDKYLATREKKPKQK